jgi:hypothetical protein
VYRKQGSELIPVVPYDRVDCDLSAEEGAIDCYDTGVCKCKLFDWMLLFVYRSLIFFIRYRGIRQQFQLLPLKEDLVFHYD